MKKIILQLNNQRITNLYKAEFLITVENKTYNLDNRKNHYLELILDDTVQEIRLVKKIMKKTMFNCMLLDIVTFDMLPVTQDFYNIINPLEETYILKLSGKSEQMYNLIYETGFFDLWFSGLKLPCMKFFNGGNVESHFIYSEANLKNGSKVAYIYYGIMMLLCAIALSIAITSIWCVPLSRIVLPGILIIGGIGILIWRVEKQKNVLKNRFEDICKVH